MLFSPLEDDNYCSLAVVHSELLRCDRDCPNVLCSDSRRRYSFRSSVSVQLPRSRDKFLDEQSSPKGEGLFPKLPTPSMPCTLLCCNKVKPHSWSGSMTHGISLPPLSFPPPPHLLPRPPHDAWAWIQTILLANVSLCYNAPLLFGISAATMLAMGLLIAC